MLAGLLLPPGFSVTISLGSEPPPLTATVTVYDGGQWRGASTASPEVLDQPGQLQAVVDQMTRRGVRG